MNQKGPACSAPHELNMAWVSSNWHNCWLHDICTTAN